MSARDIAFAVLILAGWGFNGAIIKLAIPQMPPLAFLCLRFFLSGILFLPFSRFSRQELGDLLKVGLMMNVVCYSFMFLALSKIMASTYMVLSQAQQPLNILVGWIFYKEKVGWKTWAGIGVALVGIYVLLNAPSLEAESLGMLYMALTIVTWVASNMMMKKTGVVPTSDFIAITSLAATPFLFVLSWLFEENQVSGLLESDPLPFLVSLAYQVIVMSLAMLGWQRLLARNPYSKVMPLLLLMPVFGIAGGMVILGEDPSLQFFAGSALVIAGLALVSYRHILRKKPKSPEPRAF